MDRTTSTTIVIAVILLAFAGMIIGWRARKHRQSGFARPLAVPAETGDELYAADVFYVATTVAGEPLNRIAVGGLGFRARASVIVASTGVILAIAGEPDAFIPATALRRVQRATWTIDRVVETGGLVCITWTLGAADVDSYLRVTEPERVTPIIDAIQSLLGATTSTGSETP